MIFKNNPPKKNDMRLYVRNYILYDVFLHLFEGVDNNEPTYTLWICQDSTFQDAMHGLLGFRIFEFGSWGV